MIKGVILKELREFWFKNPKATREDFIQKFNTDSINIHRWMMASGFEEKKGLDKKIRYVLMEDVKVEDITEKLPEGLSEAGEIEHLLDRGYSMISICLHQNVLYKTVENLSRDMQLARVNEYNQNKEIFPEQGDKIPGFMENLICGQRKERMDSSDLAHPKMQKIYDYKTCECIAAVIFRKMMEVGKVSSFDSSSFEQGMDNVNIPVTNAFLRDIDEIGNVPSTGDVDFDRQLLKFAASQCIGFNLYKFLYEDTRKNRDRLRSIMGKRSRDTSDEN